MPFRLRTESPKLMQQADMVHMHMHGSVALQETIVRVLQLQCYAWTCVYSYAPFCT